MTDTDQTKEQLVQELEMLQARVAELEQIEVERKRVGEALQASETRYRRLFETAKDGILILDADTGKIADVNPFLIDMLGYSHEDLMGKTLWEIGPFKDIEASQSAFTELQSQEYIRYEDLPLEAKDGRRVEVEFVSNVYQVDHKRVIQCNIRDITARVLAEHALRRTNAELQTRNQELDAFAPIVAHDLKNPVGLTLGYAEVLALDYAEMSDGQRQQSLQAILRVGHKMNNIIDELLLLAEVRQVQVGALPLDMAKIVSEAQLRLAESVVQSHAGIILPDASAWPVALGYAPWVEEVWVNYLSNALKYGGQPPRVELGATAQPDGMVRFWVRDNGPGLASEDQARLFTPFTRLNQVRVKGHGLGLSIVRRIVEKLGGRVGVESQIGRGSSFFFTLPGAVSPTTSITDKADRLLDAAKMTEGGIQVAG
jgi:PAS domain S-box-containing protein